MAEVRILHNPRCSKSRQALALLTDRGVDPTVVRYLDEPLARGELVELLDRLGGDPAALVRTGEPLFRELGVDRSSLDDAAAVADLLAEHPKLLERPVVVVGDRAVIGRPPERVLELL